MKESKEKVTHSECKGNGCDDCDHKGFIWIIMRIVGIKK